MLPYKQIITVGIWFLIWNASPFIAQQPTCDVENRFGVVDHLSWRFLYSQEDMDRALDMMNAAGIGWIRLNWSWKDIEPEQGQLNYDQFDKVAVSAAEHRIQLLAILTSIPPWSSTAPDELKEQYGNLAPVDRYRPADIEDWLLYARRVVERYDGDGHEDAPGSPRISHWEVWNEPNLKLFWPPAPDPAEYVQLLARTHEAIMGADPSAIVVLGGLSGSGVRPDGTGYLQRIYELEGASYFDVVSVHHYLHPTLGKIEQLESALTATREVMDTNGDSDIPLWLTEIGWSDAPNAWGAPTSPPEEIAQWLTDVYTAALPAEKIFWYNFRNIFDGSAEVEHNFGLVKNDFTPKSAYEAYASVTQDFDCIVMEVR